MLKILTEGNYYMQIKFSLQALFLGIIALQGTLYSNDTETVSSLIRKNNTKGIEAFFNEGISPDARNRQGDLLIGIAIVYGSPESVKLFVDRRANLTVQDGAGTLMDMASFRFLGKPSSEATTIIRLLLKNGAPVDLSKTKQLQALNAVLKQPLFVAVVSGNINNVKEALKNVSSQNQSTGILSIFKKKQTGPHINDQDEEGLTSLHWAVIRSLPEIAKLLVSSGANINAKDAQGNTPLHIAAQTGNAELTKILVMLSADLKAINNAGKTAAQVAEASQHRNVEQVLLQHQINQMAESLENIQNPHLYLPTTPANSGAYHYTTFSGGSGH
jgi:ankyrin repeat protein